MKKEIVHHFRPVCPNNEEVVDLRKQQTIFGHGCDKKLFEDERRIA
jgi:hypothetical protein